MAIPGESMSTINYPDSFQSPDDLPRCDLLQDWELGALALNDPTGGLQQDIWHFKMNGNSVLVGLDGENDYTEVTTVSNLTELSGSFDANMNPVIAYVEAGTMKIRYYDTGIPGYDTLTVAGASPRLALDDKRDNSDSSRDVLMFYIRDNSLQYRQQRDGYDTERTLMAVPANTVRLGRVGMNSSWRMQIEFLTQVS